MPNVDDIAMMLVNARRTGEALAGQPLAQALSEPAQAYAVQERVAQALGWFGDAPPRWWKSGGPSREAVLTHAPLPPAGVAPSPADLSTLPFHRRGIEAEIALRLGRAVDADLAATLDVAGARALLDAMAVSIEIVDGRWSEGMQAPALLRLADLQTHGALVLGEWVPWQPIQWATQRCRVRVGQRLDVQRTGTHPCGDPAWVLPAWLRHATRGGHTLPEGTVVTTGTWVGILDAQRGERVEVAFEGIGGAAVQL